MRKLVKKLNETFNWLAQDAKNQYTLGSMIESVSDGEARDPFGTIESSRIMRMTERVVTISGIAASVTLAAGAFATVGPIAIAAGACGCFVSKVAGVATGGIAEYSNKIALGMTRKISRRYPPKFRN